MFGVPEGLVTYVVQTIHVVPLNNTSFLHRRPSKSGQQLFLKVIDFKKTEKNARSPDWFGFWLIVSHVRCRLCPSKYLLTLQKNENSWWTAGSSDTGILFAHWSYVKRVFIWTLDRQRSIVSCYFNWWNEGPSTFVPLWDALACIHPLVVSQDLILQSLSCICNPYARISLKLGHFSAQMGMASHQSCLLESNACVPLSCFERLKLNNSGVVDSLMPGMCPCSHLIGEQRVWKTGAVVVVVVVLQYPSSKW